MGCRADGTYEYSSFASLRDDEAPGGATPFVYRSDFNRSSAFGVNPAVCHGYRWAHAKGPRLIHAGPAILGADKDIARWGAGRAG